MIDVTVLGAGVAGLAAAERLAAAGLRVAVIEARRRPGGRILTEPGHWGQLKLGAEFLHGKSRELWDAARAARLRAAEVPDVHWSRRRGRLGPGPNLWERLERVFSKLGKAGPDRSFDAFARGLSRGRGLGEDLALARPFVESFHAADAARVSARALARLGRASRRSQEERAFRPLDGYAALLKPWLRGLPPGALQLNARVEAVEWRPGAVVVRARRGRRALLFSARRALVTLPLGVLKAGTPAFVPALAQKRWALEHLEMGPVVKAVFIFEPEPFDRLGLDRAAFLHRPGEAPAVWWTAAPVQAPVLTAWAGGPKAAAPGARGSSAVRAACLDSLERLLGRAIERRAIASWRTCDWQTDPFSRGAYSWAAVEGAGAHRELARPLQGTLFFAGEATEGDGENATVAGAIRTGRRAAAEILSA